MAASIGIQKLFPTLASTMIMSRWMVTRTVDVSNHCINGQHVRRWAAAEKKSKCFIPHCRRYGTSLFSATDMRKLGRSTGDYEYDLAVDKAIQHYQKHVTMEDEYDQSIMMYPLSGASEWLSGVQMFHILLQTIGGQKYGAIYVAPLIYDSMKLDDEALKLAYFTELDEYAYLPFRKVVGEIRWPVSPRNDPLITAAARFALSVHNKEEKLERLIRANSQMVGENEIFRMTFKAEFSGESSTYDAIVLVPRENAEKMELVMIKISDDLRMYGRLMFSHGSEVIVPHTYPTFWYSYEEEIEDEYKYQYGDDERVIDDPRVTPAARFALAQYNKKKYEARLHKDRAQRHNRKDQVRRVVEATRRTYSGDEILSIRFDGELGGPWFYQAIVLVPANDPENMRLAYVGRKYDDDCDDDDDDDVFESDLEKDGFDKCSIDDPRVTEIAQLALNSYNRKNKLKDDLLFVVRAASRKDSECETYKVIFLSEDHPMATYVAKVSVPIKDPNMRRVKYVYPLVDVWHMRRSFPCSGICRGPEEFPG